MRPFPILWPLLGLPAVEVMNRFEGLELVSSVAEELWMEVRNALQEAASKTIPKKKISKKAKWLSEEALQIAEEKRREKNKGERERYIPLNADFQRTAWRDKKAFFNEQCIKLKENNRRKTRELVRKMGDIKGTFYPKMGKIKDRNDRDLVDAEEMERIHGRTAQKRFK